MTVVTGANAKPRSCADVHTWQLWECVDVHADGPTNVSEHRTLYHRFIRACWLCGSIAHVLVERHLV